MLSAGTFCLHTVSIKTPHNSKRASLVPLLESCSRKRKLPPTSGSLDLHIQRAHYIAMIWKKAGKSHPCLPAPAAFGWALNPDVSHFSPVPCSNPPAPEAVLQLIKCRCKSGCEGRCSCRKKQYPMYRILLMLGFQLQQQNKSTRY